MPTFTNDQPVMKCFTFDCTVRIPVSLTRTHCQYCQAAIDGRNTEVDRANRYHQSNAFGR